MMRLPVPWVDINDPLPHASTALDSPNGLLAAGTDLSPERVLEAYKGGVFPWFSEGQPVLWWSPDPRMVLYTDELRITRSFSKTLKAQRYNCQLVLKTDTAFESVMRACAEPRNGQDGTWITEEMIATYKNLHERGIAHSVELWNGNSLVGGLYGLNIGRMFYGESMFARQNDASKIALTGLVTILTANGCPMIDCQQNTAHLASMGGREISRRQFLDRLEVLTSEPKFEWPTGEISITPFT
jgi:leucyl/phenylalanyl-tRNA---protein transferase